MTVCLHYARPASGLNEGEIFGLDVAVNNLLKAWFRYGKTDKFICRPTDLASFDHFKALATEMGVNADERCIGLDPRHPKNNLENIGCVFRADPLIADLTWRRQQLSGPGFASCGLVHTMSGERIARAVAELCIAPSDSTDALVCPSEAIRSAVQTLWEIYSDYLGHRFGTKVSCPVQTPVIPLGIDVERFEHLTTAQKRQSQRSALDASDDEVIVLFVGRLSFATKAHPLALWQACEKAAQHVKQKIRIVMYGYFKPLDMEKHFKALALDTAREIKIDFIRNDDSRFPDGLWAAADIFTSLSDNIQESFGLTPIEAMACGLPVIISDWDGYRGHVRHGIDGFLIPTTTPPPSAGQAIAERYYNEGNYGVSLMGAAQSTALNIEACSRAVEALASSSDKRRSMGAEGRKRAHDTFAWRHVIHAYEQLWDDLSARRKAKGHSQAVPPSWPAVHPAYPNPWKMFEAFPSRTLKPDDLITVVLQKETIDSIMAHEMNFFIPELLVDKKSMQELIDAIRRAGSPPAHAILATFPILEHDRLWRCLGWMLKHGIAVTGETRP